MMYLDQSFANDGRYSGTSRDLDPSFSEVINARAEGAFELNPTRQFQNLGNLGQLEGGPKSYISETGEEVQVSRGLAADDPRAQVLSVEQANEEGKEIGIRFSEPPTRGQFDYLANMKREENGRNQILMKSRGITNEVFGFITELGATAVDPLNIASAFVPIVGEARYARLVASLGRGGGAFAKGVAEGAAGAALVDPLIYVQAQQLQQQFGLEDIFADIIVGGILGGGLHYGALKIGDAFRGGPPKPPLMIEDMRGRPVTYSSDVDWRTIKVSEGENVSLVQGMTREERAGTLNAAVKSLESDNFPRVSELLRTLPEASVRGMTDTKYPATTRMPSKMTAADFVKDSATTDIIDAHLASSVKGADAADPKVAFDSLLKHYKKNTSKLSDWSVWTRSDEMYRREAPSDMLEHPEQKAYVDVEAKTIVASDTASLAAVRHEIERALDTVQGYKGDQAGGYRYRRGDKDGPVIHRKVMSQLYKQDPSRAPTPELKPEQAVDLFSRPEPIMKPAEAESQKIWDQVENDKDKDLDTLMKDEEIEVIEDTARTLQNNARAKGVIEQVTPAEERDLFDEASIKSASKSIADTVEQSLQETVDDGLPANEMELAVMAALSADPVTLARYMRGEITPREMIDAVGQEPPARTPDLDEEGDTAAKAEDEPQDEDALLEAMSKQVAEVLTMSTPEDLANMEARAVANEQQHLSGHRAVKDLFSEAEKAEFDEANSTRAFRETPGADGAVQGAATGPQSAGPSAGDGFQQVDLSGDGEAILGQGSFIDAERGAAGGNRSPVETTQSIGRGAVPSRVITPDGSIEIGVEPIIVEYGSLRKAEGKFQPRDRSRKESSVNIRERANKLDPEQLMPTRVSDSGPPIITQDGMVISGNGRYMTLGTVYLSPELGYQAQRYRERLGEAANGFKQPILVMRITDAVDEDTLVEFADRSNRGRIEQMSATEKAQRDAQVAGIDLMQMYQGGDYTSRENQPFMRAFMRKVATTAELGEMSKNGVLTKEGVDRMNAAVLATAYDDTGILSLMLESADDNIRSITRAYRDAAPAIMKLRAEIARGDVMPDLDITPFMMTAARIISEQRDKGVKIASFLAQQDAFNKLDPTVETLIRAFYNKEMTRAASSLRIVEYLDDFVSEARQHKTGGFIVDDTRIEDVIAISERKRAQRNTPDDDEPQSGILESESRPVQSAPEERPAPPQPAPKGAGGEAGAANAKPAATKSVSGNPRVARLQALAGDKGAFDAQVDRYSASLKKADLEAAAVKWLGRQLTPAELKTRGTIGKAIKDNPQAKQPAKQLTPETAKSIEDAKEYLAKNPAPEPAAEHQTELIVEPAASREVAESRAGRDPNRAASLERVMGSYVERLRMVEESIRAKVIAAKGLIKDEARLGEMQDRINKLRSGEAENVRSDFGNLVAKVLGVNEQAIKDARAVALEKKARFVKSAAKQMMDDYNMLVREANGLMEDIEVMRRERDKAVGLATPEGAGPALIGRELKEAVHNLDAVYLSKKDRLRWKAWLEADTKLRSDILGGLASEDARKRALEHQAEGNALIAEHDRQKAEDTADTDAGAMRQDDIKAAEDISAKQLAPFYDYLKGEGPVKSIRNIVRVLGVTTEQAGKMLDHAVESGWLKLKDDGTYIRVAKKDRPAEPELAMANPRGWDVIEPFDEKTLDPMHMHEEGAIDFIADRNNESRQDILEDFGYSDRSDYVRFAEKYGFYRDSWYWDKVLMRQLQTNLMTIKVIGEAVRILPAHIQVKIYENLYDRYGNRPYGLFTPRYNLVEIANAHDYGIPITSIHHETIHALRNMGLFTEYEWKMVMDAAKAGNWLDQRAGFGKDFTKTYQDYYAKQVESGFMSRAEADALIAEEGFALQYGFWAEKRYNSKPTTPMEMLFQRVRDFLDKLMFHAKKLFGAESAEDVFKAVYRGDIAQRWQGWNDGRVDPSSERTMAHLARKEDVQDLNAQMKELAIDDSEKKGNKAVKSAEALVPCATYHL